MASIHQTIFYVHQARFAKCEGYEERIEMPSIECELHRSCYANAVLRLQWKTSKSGYIPVQTRSVKKRLPNILG